MIDSKEKLQEIIELNKSTQNQAKQLNLRAGKTVFPLMSGCEMKSWLAEQLGRARCIAELKNFEALLLPKLDVELVATVMSENPDTFMVDGSVLQLKYSTDGWDRFYCRASVSEEFIRGSQLSQVVLPNGRVVELDVYSYRSQNIPELVVKVEESRIQMALQAAQRHYCVGLVSDTDLVLSWLEKAGVRVEVTKLDNGQGESVYRYLAIKYDSCYSEWKRVLVESKEEAVKETKESLEHLLKTATKQYLEVPEEAPWSKKDSGWYASWSLTDMGLSLRSRFDGLVETHAQGLTAENIAEKIATVKTVAQEARTKVGGEHVAVQEQIKTASEQVEQVIENLESCSYVRSEIVTARAQIRQAEEKFSSALYTDVKELCQQAVELVNKLESLNITREQQREEAKEEFSKVEDDLADLRCREGDFVQATSEEQEQASRIKIDIRDAFDNHQYEVVLAKVDSIYELVETVLDSTPEREEARRKRFPESVWNAVCNDEDLAEKAVQFAKTAADFVGQARALSVFKQEFGANYGRARRQDGVKNTIYKLLQTDIGDEFFNLYRAGDVDCWFGGAVAWLEAQEDEVVVDKKARAGVVGASFEFSSNRNFKCACGCTIKITKSEWRFYNKEEQAIKLNCIACGAKGMVCKAKSIDSEEQSEEEDGATVSVVDTLKDAWKC